MHTSTISCRRGNSSTANTDPLVFGGADHSPEFARTFAPHERSLEELQKIVSWNGVRNQVSVQAHLDGSWMVHNSVIPEGLGFDAEVYFLPSLHYFFATRKKGTSTHLRAYKGSHLYCSCTQVLADKSPRGCPGIHLR